MKKFQWADLVITEYGKGQITELDGHENYKVVYDDGKAIWHKAEEMTLRVQNPDELADEREGEE